MGPIEIDLGICRLRPFRPEDAPSLARHADDRAVWINLRDGFPHPYTLADARAWLGSEAAIGERPTNLAIEVEGEAAGSIGLALDPASASRSAELGYWLGRAYWGRGIASAAVRAIRDHAFAGLGLDRLHACVFEGNPASARVLEKAGFSYEGRSACGSSKGGRVVGSLLYGLRREDHRPGSGSSAGGLDFGRPGGTGR